MIGFVDDTSGSTNNFLHPNQMSMDHYIDLATNDAQRWNDVLHVTGAALNETKCSYHFLTFNFTLSGLAFAKGDTFDPVIAIRYNSNHHEDKLTQLSNYQPHKTLGVWKALAGADQTRGKKLEEKNSVHAKTIINSPFDCKDVWTYYHSVYLPSITYSFPSTNMLESSLSAMQKEIKGAVLPKYRFNRNTPLAIVYRNSDFAGIEMRDLHVEKGLAQLSHLMMAI